MLTQGTTPFDKGKRTKHLSPSDSLLQEYYNQIELEDLLDFVMEYIVSSAPRRRKLSIHAIGHAIPSVKYEPSNPFGTPILDLHAWRLGKQDYNPVLAVGEWLTMRGMVHTPTNSTIQS
ncbi:hypothetical protein DSO57_1029972 [Entomophthora muscae]|uniref:Uncharacterized protein n=1 Tax=Entomophthora muscae TaxID=34485 RepID=A0ACC2TCD6_9FUNG|nr:hypothetical protein DSO57_1029972 [Entomophthora muscae]